MNRTNPSTSASARPLTDREARVLAHYRQLRCEYHRTLHVARTLGMPADDVRKAAQRLSDRGLLLRSFAVAQPRYRAMTARELA